MIALQLACAAIVAAYVTVRVRADRSSLSRLALLALASFIGEDSVIRAYGFYAYSPAWSAFLDRTPLLIALIWPVVIDSAGELARALVGAKSGALRMAIVAGAIVALDAALIEPIAVHAGLWSWSEPGVFAVPPIGMIGWGFFAAGCVLALERARASVVAIGPLVAHALLLASWWTVFRWVSGAIPPWPFAACATIALIAVSAWLVARRARVAPSLLARRLPGAAFFFVLLALTARDAPALVVYAIPFAAPYVALIVLAMLPRRASSLRAPAATGSAARLALLRRPR